MRTLLLLVALCFPAAQASAGDVAVQSVEVTYEDSVTTLGEVVVRELKSFHDDTFWSKPDRVTVTAEIGNAGKTAANYIHVTAELYYKLKASKSEFPPLHQELRTVTDKPVWVWVNTLGSSSIRRLQPGEGKKLVFNKVRIQSQYYATDYQIQALTIRVFAEPRGGDDNYADNVKDRMIAYGD